MDHNRSQLRPRPCRGNTLILVVGILVLLVIIATSYITRTHAGRITGVAVQRAERRDDNARLIADMLAQEIAEALFVRPVDRFDPDVLAGGVADSSVRRLSPLRIPLRYGTDKDIDQDLNGVLEPDQPYNFAPFHVVPFTNWPDAPPGGPADLFWPDGPGNLGGGGGGSPNLDTEGNPLGNPGFGDTRWLRDIEPMRWDTGTLDAFSHWRHLSNIARPNNGYRICRDISNATDILTDLSIPVEQWLAARPAANDPVTGDSVYPGVALFIQQWSSWLGPGYRSMYWRDTGTAFGGFPPPSNFYRLSDLNADGFTLDVGERPQDEFIAGTARWDVSRVLADTDGDGYTDSFWFLCPTPIEGGIRQIVAVSIVDNSGLLNANVATRGSRFNTTGDTPSDL